MIRRLWQWIWGERLYTPDEVLLVVGAVLRGTFDRGLVEGLIEEIDQFHAGEMDTPLQKHVMKAFRKMRWADNGRNFEKLEHWADELGAKEYRDLAAD